jgi:sugar phosphate isomerase/epimerase
VHRDSDRATRAAALERARRALSVAEEIGASCAVNIAGSRGYQWDGPDEKNLRPETYGLIVDTVREIIDAVDVSLRHPFPAFAVISAPALYYSNGGFITEFVREFGPRIKAVHLQELRPGLGRLDYRALLSELERVSTNMPLLIEHLKSEQEYVESARYLRGVAASVGVPL